MASRIEARSPVMDDKVRKTIQSIKEIFRNHSEDDIHAVLKETNMDPDETAQKLLIQDPFREVRRKRDKKKEEPTHQSYRKQYENGGHRMKLVTSTDHNVRRGSNARNTFTGTNRQFRVVKDNRANMNASREVKPSLPSSLTIPDEKVAVNVFERGSTGIPGGQKPFSGRNSFRAPNGHSLPRRNGDVHSGSIKKDLAEDKRAVTPNAVAKVQPMKINKSQAHPSNAASNSSVTGVYSSSTDPVHVPSPDSRSSHAVGAIRREVGVVGVRRLPSDKIEKGSSVPNGSLSTILKKDGSSESYQHFSSIAKADQLNQTVVQDSVMPSIPASRSLFSTQHSNRMHQAGGHQKAVTYNKEWKPKSSKKPNVSGPGVIGTPKTLSSSTDNKKLVSEAPAVQDKHSLVKTGDSQKVIIAHHIRVPKTDRGRLMFGSFGAEFDSSGRLASGLQEDCITENGDAEATASLTMSAPKISDDGTGGFTADILDDKVKHPASDVPLSSAASDEQVLDKKEASSSQNLDNYVDVELVHDNRPTYTPEPNQRQDPPELPTYPAYNPQSGYDLSYFRPTMDETLHAQGLPHHQESLSSHTANNIPASTISMQQQQQAQVQQMYPQQLHVSHYANIMPYRPFVSPFYVPQMAMPGYSGNQGYPHPSNGSSYVLMPGSSSHLSANALKYGIQQYKQVQVGNPTAFGNYANPTAYALNAPGVVGNPSGLEDSSRLKYKDGNLYVPNRQAETSEMWIQNPREVQGLQAAQYYNIQGQTPHGTYIPSHNGHPSFNAAAAQSSHMQYPGLFHPTQPTAMPNPHHIGPAMGPNVAQAAPGAQIGAYQQPQLGHLNWTPNF